MTLRTEGTRRERLERLRKYNWGLEISVELSCGLRCVESCIGGPRMYQGLPQRDRGSAKADIVR